MNDTEQTDTSLVPAKEKPMIKLGLDVHAKQITVCRQDGDGRPQPPRRLSWEQLLALARALVASGAEVHSCYEAGPCGYGLHRTLTELGAQNLVVAPQRWDERGERVKTDGRDARALEDRLDRYLRGNQKVFAVVRVPTPAEEQRRSLVRRRTAVLWERNRCALRGGSLLLGQGFRVAREWWQLAHWPELSAQLPAWLRETVGYWQQQALRLDTDLVALEPSVKQQSAGKLLPKGYGQLTDAVVESEILDWHRFKNRRQVGSYTGLCPSEYSTGDTRQQGAITKHGNPRVRHYLVEAVWRLERWQPDYAPLQMLRAAKGKRARKRAAVAVARRLAIDLWRLAIGQTTAAHLRLVMGSTPAA
jgi:transposase